MSESLDQLAIVSEGSDSVLDDLVEVLTNRLQAGQSADLDEVARRHPEYVERLRLLLPALAMMADFRHSSSRELEGVDVAGLGRDVGVLGDFRIVREIGRGGMGVVYEAQQLSLDRRVALKVLPLAAALDGKQLQRFQLEAHAAACLHHTNIVPVHAVGCERGVPFYAMQLIEGRSLAQLIAELRRTEGSDQAEQPPARLARVSTSTLAADLTGGPLAGGTGRPIGQNTTVAQGERQDEPGSATRTKSPQPGTSTPRLGGESSSRSSTRSRHYIRTAAQLGAQVADALDHAHTRGILHRDIKTANLLLDGLGQLWVTDFGLAQMQGNPGLTLTGDVVGTLRYMSPEQALAKRVVIDGRTDIYSLGVTLYELLTLRPAIDGPDRAEILRKIAQDEPAPPRKLNPAIPRDLETILLKAMAKEPSGRYGTARELADELRRLLDDKPIRARRPSLLDRAAKWARRHHAVVATGVVGLLVVAAILAGGTGWIVRDRAARLAVTEREVIRALGEATSLQSQSKWPEALEAAKRAEGFLAAGASESLCRRVAELGKDLEMVLRLDEIWLPSPRSGSEGAHDDRKADALYAEAFRNYGIDVDALDPAEASRRIRGRTIRLELAVALDCWADRRQQGLQTRDVVRDGWPDDRVPMPASSAASWKRLIAVARAADPDERRDQVRAALEERDRKMLCKLAASAEMTNLPVQTLSVVCRHLDDQYGQPILRRAQLENPDNYHINFQLAWGNPDPDETIRFYTAALAIRPRNAAAAYFLGMALRRRGNFDQAISLFRRAIALDSNFEAPYQGIVETLQRLGKRDEAMAEIRAAVAAKPENAPLNNNIAWMLATCAGPQFRDHRLAVELGRRAVQLAPNEGNYWNTLGAANYRTGNWKDSIAALEKSMTLRKGGDSYDWFFLAMACWQLGRHDEARRWYDRAVLWMEKRDPNHHELRLFRAEAAALLGLAEPAAPAQKEVPHRAKS
jgi:serine/threonine protein kinase/Flp pilus assembly protein TadD